MGERRFKIGDVLQGVCNNWELPYRHDEVNDIHRVGLQAENYFLNTGVHVDKNNAGYTTFTPLGIVDNNNLGTVARNVLENSSRGITPVLKQNIFGIETSATNLPDTKRAIESSLMDTFGTIVNYADTVFPNIMGVKKP